MSLHSAVSTVSMLCADKPKFKSWKGKRIFFPKTFTPNLGPTLPPIQWVPGDFPWTEQPEHEVDNSLPSSAKVKNDRNYNFTDTYAFMELTGEALLFIFY